MEHLNKKLFFASEEARYKVCYLLISHGTFVDEAAHIFDFVEKGKAISSAEFFNLEDEQRSKL